MMYSQRNQRKKVSKGARGDMNNGKTIMDCGKLSRGYGQGGLNNTKYIQ